MNKTECMQQLKGGLIVSCQALPGEPLYREEGSIMYLMARAAKAAGAVAIRTNGVEDVKAIKKETGLPVIGLIKKEYAGFEQYITVTMEEVDALVDAGADIIALDCTLRPRGDGLEVEAFIAQIKEKYPHLILMADISTLEEGIHAYKSGVDLVGTTMSGYTEYSAKLEGPDYNLVEELVQVLSIPVIAEGRIHEPQEAAAMFEKGAHAVVVGSAITRPLEIAERFVKAIERVK